MLNPSSIVVQTFKLCVRTPGKPQMAASSTVGDRRCLVRTRRGKCCVNAEPAISGLGDTAVFSLACLTDALRTRGGYSWPVLPSQGW